MLGGAMYAWERAFKRFKDGSLPWWAKVGAVSFALFAIVATIGTGSAVQSAAMTGIIESNFPGIPEWLIALAISVLAVRQGYLRRCENRLGGVREARSVHGGCLCRRLSGHHGHQLAVYWPCVSPSSSNGAFTSKAAFGGAGGVGASWLLCSSVAPAWVCFSNESGLGSAPIVAAAAATKNPARQALVAMTGTFWSTVVICAITGIVLVSTMLAHPGIVEGGSIKEGAALASAAFATIPYLGTPILVIGMISFCVFNHSLAGAITAIVAQRTSLAVAPSFPYQILYVIVGFLGSDRRGRCGLGCVRTLVTRSWLFRQHHHGAYAVRHDRARNEALCLRRQS